MTASAPDQLVDERPAEIVVFEEFSRGWPENITWALARGPATVVEGDLRDQRVIQVVGNPARHCDGSASVGPGWMKPCVPV